MTWQPIETAPKDRPILLACYDEGGPYYVQEVGWWEPEKGGYWSQASDGEPTHWMPLPDPPKTSA